MKRISVQAYESLAICCLYHTAYAALLILNRQVCGGTSSIKFQSESFQAWNFFLNVRVVSPISEAVAVRLSTSGWVSISIVFVFIYSVDGSVNINYDVTGSCVAK